MEFEVYERILRTNLLLRKLIKYSNTLSHSLLLFETLNAYFVYLIVRLDGGIPNVFLIAIVSCHLVHKSI